MHSGFAGFRFDGTDLDQVLDWLAKRRDCTDFAYVVTPNVDHAVRLADNPQWNELHCAYREADLSLCDSRILALLARVAGKRLDVVPGSDLVARFLEGGVLPGSTLMVIGSDEISLARLRDKVPQVHLAQHVPPMGVLENDAAMEACVAAVLAAKADYVLLAIGSPQQELLASRIASHPQARGTALCIGASIDFLTGHARRAPRWMQWLALEWLHRLLCEPRRMARRYLIDGPRILRIAFTR